MDTNIIKFSDIVLKASEKPRNREAILDVVVRPSITEVLQKAGLDPLPSSTGRTRQSWST